ncbi:hypothetical protein ElyMa_004135300 [Elysia marginata]|uniref:Uncharacterized protein n=1 Tax=Elysia marginata TaxID=1093978 RepID=A0AAV4GHL4_9GAST|nr:hypothetical protein ElyMa_004135300 [Elysia marginata]
MTTRLVTLELTGTLRTKVFIGLNQHSPDNHRIADDDDHISQIVKEICALFCKIVLNQHGRQYTERFIHKIIGPRISSPQADKNYSFSSCLKANRDKSGGTGELLGGLG